MSESRHSVFRALLHEHTDDEALRRQWAHRYVLANGPFDHDGQAQHALADAWTAAVATSTGYGR